MKHKFTFAITGHEDIPNLPTRFTYKLSDIKGEVGKIIVSVHYGDAKLIALLVRSCGCKSVNILM